MFNYFAKASVAVNECIGGPKGYSVCASLWEARLNGSVWASHLCAAVDTVLAWKEDQHCRRAWLLRNK